MKDVTLLVLGPDGRIVQTSGPHAWQGKRIAHAVGLSAEVVVAAEELLLEARTSASWINRRFVTESDRTYELIVIEAVPLRRSPTNVSDILTRTTELLLEQARAIEVLLQVSTDPDMPAQLVVDGEKIAWGVATLVGSALRHLTRKSHDKGAVRVRAKYLSGSDEVAVIVHDNGPGIPSERLLGILTPGPDGAHSPALALIMLQDVVGAHGGRLEIDSSIDPKSHGTTVSLYLPAQSV
jgi:nitrogen-specific signal transduction histidine kinase